MALPPCRPDFLGKTGPVVRDNPPRSLHNLAAAAVIGIQENFSRTGIIPFKAQHQLRLCPAEPVNGLVVIPHNKQVVSGKGQHFYDFILNPVNVLELIY